MRVRIRWNERNAPGTQRHECGQGKSSLGLKPEQDSEQYALSLRSGYRMGRPWCRRKSSGAITIYKPNTVTVGHVFHLAWHYYGIDSSCGWCRHGVEGPIQIK